MFKMIELNSYYVFLKNTGYVLVYADSYELYQDGEYKVYQFMNNGNYTFVIDIDMVKDIQVSGKYTMILE